MLQTDDINDHVLAFMKLAFTEKEGKTIEVNVNSIMCNSLLFKYLF